MSSDLELRRTPPWLQTDISDEDHGCTTPTAAEHRIPAILSCPPGPRKRRMEAAACRLKVQFFESVVGEEIEAFFRSSFELVAKRRCRPCI